MSHMRLLLILFALCPLISAFAAEPRLLAHYMPCYAAKDVSGAWGWHWTMNHFNPEQFKWDAQWKIASHKHTIMQELGGFDHGKMPEPAFPQLLKFVE